jgi:hypothetical protein
MRRDSQSHAFTPGSSYDLYAYRKSRWRGASTNNRTGPPGQIISLGIAEAVNPVVIIGRMVRQGREGVNRTDNGVEFLEKRKL